MKILHLPTSVAGNPIGLSKAERSIGLDSHCLDISPNNKFGYQADILPTYHSLSQYGLPGKAISLLATFWENRTKFDIFHFNTGHTLMDYYPWNLNYLDLPFYPKGKKIIMTFNGSDARQSASNKIFSSLASWDEEISYNHLYNDPALNKIKQRRIKIIDKYADHILTVNPDLFKFLPKRAKFLPYTISTWDAIKHKSGKEIASGRKINIVHAPSNRDIKGTKYILEALSKLQLKYKNVEVSLVENQSNKKALAIYEKADLVIDQLMIGWYGGLAVEAMKMGKPIMVFIRESDLKYIPSQMAQDCKKTFINANPTNIYEKLCMIIENPKLLSEQASASLEYVHKWHDPLITARYVADNFYYDKLR